MTPPARTDAVRIAEQFEQRQGGTAEQPTQRRRSDRGPDVSGVIEETVTTAHFARLPRRAGRPLLFAPRFPPVPFAPARFAPPP